MLWSERNNVDQPSLWNGMITDVVGSSDKYVRLRQLKQNRFVAGNPQNKQKKSYGAEAKDATTSASPAAMWHKSG